jgi:hypothetical protein
MRQIDKFIIHISHNLFPLNEYSEGEMKKLMAQFKEEADDLNINITDTQLKAYIERFDALKNSPKVTEKDLRKYTLSKLIKLVSSSKGAEVPDETDITPDIVYNENGIIIYNGSNEENCLNFGRGEKWCITRGSFGNYRYDANRKNPTFYLVKDTNLSDDDRKSFFVVVVGSDDTYKVSDRSNNDVGGRQTEWDRWEPWSFVEREFPSVRGLHRVFKYIPLSSSEKLSQDYKNSPVDIRTFTKFPYSVKEQYLVVRKGKELFSDIKTDEFIEKYLPKYPQLATFISVNAGIIPSTTLAKHLDKFSNQDTRSIISNMRDKLPISNLSSEAIPFEIKKFLLKFDKWDIKPNERIYVTKDGKAIVKLDINDDIKVGVYTEDDDYPNVKLNKRTSKFLLDYPDLDKIPVRNLIKLVQDEIIDRDVLDKVLEQAKTDPNSAIIVKGNIILDSNSFSSYKTTDGKIEKVPFDDEEVQAIFSEQKDNEGFQQNALALISDRERIPENVDKDAFISILRATPLDKRIIRYGNAPCVVLTTQSPQHPIVVQNISRGTSSFQLTAWYGEDEDWRRTGGRGSLSRDPEVYRALFTYLRQQGQSYSDTILINNLKQASNQYRPQEVIKAIIQAGIPLDANSIYKPIMYEDVPYIINSQDPRSSYGVSDTTGKLVKVNISPSVAARILGTAAPATTQAATGRRGRPAGVPNAPRPAVQQAPAATGNINVEEVMNETGLDIAFLRLPRPILRRLNVATGVRVDPNGDRGVARRNNQLGFRGRVGRVIAVGNSKIYFIRLANQQVIASINVQPGNSNYILLPNASGNAVIPLGSPSDLLSALQQRNLAEHHNYLVREYLENNPTHRDEVKTMLKSHLDEFNAKKAIATGALALGLAGNPNTAKAQNFQGLKDKFKAGITAVQNKLNPQPKVDTVKVQKDTPLLLSKFKDYKGAGYGFAESKDKSIVQVMARLKATADLMKKLDKTQMTAGIEEKDSKIYQLPDGTYQCEMLVVVGN